jgi:hypothetical protein
MQKILEVFLTGLYSYNTQFLLLTHVYRLTARLVRLKAHTGTVSTADSDFTMPQDHMLCFPKFGSCSVTDMSNFLTNFVD